MNDHRPQSPAFEAPPVADAPLFDLYDMRRALFRNWKVVLCFAAAGFLVGLIRLHMMPRTYLVQMTVTPVSANQSDTSSQLSGLASLAGLRLKGMDNLSQFQLYLNGLTSHEVAMAMAADQGLMHELFATEWDAKAQRWRTPARGLVGTVTSAVRKFIGLPVAAWHTPDAESVQAYLQYGLKVTTDPRMPYIATVSMQSPNPSFAVQILQAASKFSDNHLRQQSLRRTQQYITYLTGQLQTVSIAEQREAITNALDDQEKYAMMASAGQYFAADVFDRPSYSSTPVSPKPSTVYGLAIVLWTALGIAFVLARDRFQDRLRALTERNERLRRLPRVLQRALVGS